MIDSYLEAHIRDALATDARTNLLDAQVTITAGKVFLMGAVESEERRVAIEIVVREIAPAELVIINEICVDCFETPASAEERI